MGGLCRVGEVGGKGRDWGGRVGVPVEVCVWRNMRGAAGKLGRGFWTCCRVNIAIWL